MTYAIPKINDQKLNELAKRIRPIFKHGPSTYWIKVIDLKNVAFTWEPEIAGKAEGLIEVCRIKTLHTYGHPMMFKPSIAEVISQIPEEYIDKVDGFMTIGPKDVADINREKEALDQGFHVAETILYRKVV